MGGKTAIYLVRAKKSAEMTPDSNESGETLLISETAQTSSAPERDFTLP